MAEHIQYRRPQIKKSRCDFRIQPTHHPLAQGSSIVGVNQHGTTRALLTQLWMIKIQVVGTRNFGTNEDAIGYPRHMAAYVTQTG